MYCCVRTNVKDQMIYKCQCIDGNCIQIVMIRVIALTPNFIIKQKKHTKQDYWQNQVKYH